MTVDARAALEFARTQRPGIGDAPLLPAPKDSTRCVSRHRVRQWWDKAIELAGLEPVPGRGWHSLRRKLASDLKSVSPKTLCQLGGWKSYQTVLVCYQRADEAEMREALEGRRRA